MGQCWSVMPRPHRRLVCRRSAGAAFDSSNRVSAELPELSMGSDTLRKFDRLQGDIAQRQNFDP